MVRTELTKKVTFEPKLQKDKYFAVDPAIPVSTSFLLIQNLWEWGLEIHVLTSLLCPVTFISHHLMGNRWGDSGNSVRLYFLGLQNHCRW